MVEKITHYTDSLVGLDQKRKSQIKGNIRADILKDSLTWYTFRKNVRTLGAVKMHFTFKCKHTKRDSVHELTEELDDDFVKKDKEEKDSPLSGFFAKVQYDLGVDYKTFELLLEHFMRRRIPIEDQGPQNKNDLRAYFRKEFKSNRMSWNSLVKGFDFLCVLECEMVLLISYKHEGITSTHTYKFALSEMEDHKRQDKEPKRDIF